MTNHVMKFVKLVKLVKLARGLVHNYDLRIDQALAAKDTAKAAKFIKARNVALASLSTIEAQLLDFVCNDLDLITLKEKPHA
ncbi:MAG: hypothetical protein ACOYL5_09640 [Phototrophicaceae bacterium]